MDEQRAWIKSRRRKHLRIVAVALCICLLVTARPDLLATFSAIASEWKDSTVYVSGFRELPEEVREQTVPLETRVEELSLPDTLEAFAAAPEEDDKPEDVDKPGDGEDGAEKPGDGEGGTENPGGGEGGTENPGDGEDGSGNSGEGSSDDTGNPGEGSDGGSGDAGNPGEGSNGGSGDAGNPGEGSGSGDAGNPGEGSDGGSGDSGNLGEGSGSGDAGNPDEGSDDGSGDAGNPGEESDGVSGDGENPGEGSDGGSGDSGNSGEGSDGEPETHSDSAPADDDGAAAADGMAKESDGALNVQRGVFVMPVYLSEPVDVAEPQTMERKEESVMIKGVTWQSEPVYDGNVEGIYVFTAVLPEGYALTEGSSLPQITVTVQGENQGEDPVVQELLARIAALPDAEAYLAGEPDVEEKEAYEAWMDGLSAYTAEAFALWEMYETLTEEQRAQISTEALEKIAAWVELAGQLAEDNENAGVLADTAEGTGTISLTLWLDGKPWEEEQKVQLKPEAGGDAVTAVSKGGGVYEADVESGGSYFVRVNDRDVEKESFLTAGDARTLYYRSVVCEMGEATGGTLPGKVSVYCGGIGLPEPSVWTYTINRMQTLTKEGCTQTGWSETNGGGKAETIAIDPKGETAVVLYPAFEPAIVTIHAMNCRPDGLEADETGAYRAVVGDGDYSVAFIPYEGYSVPTYVTVSSGSRYSYQNGVLTIYRNTITRNVVITARAVDQEGWISFGGEYTTKWKLADNTLTIGGEGEMPDWSDYKECPWHDDASKIKRVVIEDKVNSIGNYAFSDCAVTDVTIPCSVTRIGKEAFYRCISLTSMDIPEGVEVIGDFAFSNCRSLESVVIPDSVREIGGNAFFACKVLNNVTIPKSVTSIGAGAFNSCEGLTSMIIPESVTKIENAMFMYCYALTSVTIPESVTSIGNQAFDNCSALTGVTLPGGMKTIGKHVFRNCTSLASVAIPGNVESIGDMSFSGCTALESVTFQGTDTIPTLGTDCFLNCPCVASDAKGISVPTCNYVKANGWDAYQNHVKRSDGGGLHKTLAKTEENPAACGKEGQEAYWTCEECGTLFSDAAGTAVITEPVTIPAKGHALSYATDFTAGTITESCGNGCGHTVRATFDGSDMQTYTGSEIKPFVVRYSPDADTWLGETKPAIGYAGNIIDVGTATATLSAGSVSVNKTFTITAKSLTDASVTAALPSTSYQYTGQAIKPTVTVRDSGIDGGRTLEKDTDYTVTYQNNTAVSTDNNKAQVIIRGMGNYEGERIEKFTIQDKAPEVSEDDLDFSGGTVKLPGDIIDKVNKGELEIWDSDGKKIIPNPDGSLPVEPGTTITIKYPGSDQGTVIRIPSRPGAPAPKKVTVTDKTATVSNPAEGEEYVLVAEGAAPDWSKAQIDTTFAGLTPNTAYELYVRKQATTDSFASEPAKTRIRTSVTIKEPETGGAGADKPGNAVSGGTPGADGGSVTYTGTCEKEYTPVIIVDGREIIPDITWDADGETGTWSYTVPVGDGDSEVGIRVEFRDRIYTGLEIEPGILSIYADNAANQNAGTLLDYLKAHCAVKMTYDNGTNDDATTGADYTVNRDFNVKGAGYEYTVTAGNKGKITLTVKPINAAVEAPDVLTRTKQSGGYTKAEVDAWLPAEVTVTYTGDSGYAQRTESRHVTWNTDALGESFGATVGRKRISGTVELPAWATGGDAVSIGIEFVDRSNLTDDQIKLSISGWAYGAQAAPAPRGSVTVTDTEQTYTYRYRAENSTSWVAADGLPKSGSGNIVPGDYQVEMTYIGRNYTGTKTETFTVVQKPVTAEKGTLAVENRRYDGTTKATLKAGGKPALSGVVGEDDVSLGGTLKAVFTNKGPKKDIPVTVTGFALTGRDAGYYKLINTTLTLRATINNKDGSAPSNGSSGSGGGNNGGGNSGSSGSGDGNSGGGNSGSSGSGDSNSGNNGNSGGSNGNTTGTGGNKGGTGGSTGTGSSGTGANKGGTGGATGTGSNKGTDGTGKGSATGGTDKAGGNTGSGSDGTGKGSVGNGKDGFGNGNNSNDGNGSNGGSGTGDAGAQQTESVTVQTVQAAVDDGRIVIPDGMEAPVAIGTLTGDAPGTTRLMVGEGSVTVTVVCEDDQYTAGMNDATAVANAVLTPEQIQLVDSGENLEIRVDIKNIAQSVPEQDRETVEKGYEAYGKYLPELKRGGYVDISVYMKTGKGGWNAVSETSEPMEVVIGIPEGLRGDGREYYVIRAHEGRYSLLNDMDDVPETITIVTDMFSSYAIAYREAGDAGAVSGAAAYGMSDISLSFLRIVCFIWVMAAAAGIMIAVIALRRKRRG